MKNVGMIGHFALKEKKNDGQTVKTNEIYKELSKNEELNIQIVDTQNYKKKIVRFIVECFELLKNNDYIIIVVASGGIKILIPYFIILNIFFHKKICYCSVGSWFDIRIKNNIILKNCSKKLDKIFVETSNLKKNLNEIGLLNVEILYNFKHIKENQSDVKRQKNSFCIFSRVIKEKGIEDAIYAINKLNNNNIPCKLYIYGPVDKKYRKEFYDILKNSSNNIKYCGLVASDESEEYISKYWMLLFPTHYLKEGLPGTIIDAYNSSTPVIASEWLSASEFVPSEVGYCYKFANKEKLYEKMLFCIQNSNEVEKKRNNTKKFVKKFEPNNAIKPLLKFLDL